MNALMVEQNVERIQYVETQLDHMNVTVKMVLKREEGYALVGVMNMLQRLAICRINDQQYHLFVASTTFSRTCPSLLDLRFLPPSIGVSSSH